MLLMTKLKNQLKEYDSDYVPVLHNIQVNGRKRGCCGFVSNPANGRVVYVDTESSCYVPLSGNSLLRYARDTKDYCGGRNEFVPVGDTAKAIHKMLSAACEVRF